MADVSHIEVFRLRAGTAPEHLRQPLGRIVDPDQIRQLLAQWASEVPSTVTSLEGTPMMEFIVYYTDGHHEVVRRCELPPT